MNKFLKNSAIIVSIGAILFTGLVSVKEYLNSTDLKGAPQPIPPPITMEMEKKLFDLNNNPIDTASSGDTVKYKITVTNTGRSDINDIEIEDVLPTLLVYVSSSDPTYNPDNPNASDNVWNISSLPASESRTLEIIVNITGEMGDNIKNTAVMTSPILDPQLEASYVFTVSCEWSVIDDTNTDNTLAGPFNGNSVTALLKFSDGTVWVAIKGDGIYQLEDHTTILRHYQSPNLISDNVFNLFEDSSDSLWVGSNGGVTKIEDPTGTPVFTQYSDVDFDVDTVYSITELNGLMYFGTDKTLYKFDNNDESFNDIINISNLDIRSNDITTDGSKLWMWLISSTEQLHSYNPTTNTWDPSLPVPEDPTFLHNTSILADSLGNIWAHQESPNRLVKYNGTTGDEIPTSLPNLPVGAVITDIEEDFFGNIVVTSSNKGAVIGDPVTETFTLYDTTVSPINTNSVPGGVVINNAREYYFGTNKGINILSCNPVSISLDPKRGSIDGDNTVTLTGEEFTHKFNEENMTLTLTVDGVGVDTENITEDTLTYVAPDHEEGSVDVTLTLDPEEGDTEEGTTQYTYVPVPTTPKVHNIDAVNQGTPGRLVPITNLINPVFTAQNTRDIDIDKFRVRVSNNDPLFNTENIVADFEGSFSGQWSTRMGETDNNSQFIAQAIDSNNNIITAYHFTPSENLASKATNERNLAIPPTGALQVFKEDGAFVWKERIGENDIYTLTDIDVTSDNKIAVVGYVTGSEDIVADTSNARNLVADDVPTAFFSVYEYDSEEEEYVQLFHKRDIDNSNYTDVEIDSHNNIILFGHKNTPVLTQSNNTRALIQDTESNQEVFVQIFTPDNGGYSLLNEKTFPIADTYIQTPVNIDIDSNDKVIVAYDEIEMISDIPPPEVVNIQDRPLVQDLPLTPTYRTIIQILDNNNDYNVLDTFIFDNDEIYTKEQHTGFVVYVDKNDNIVYARNIRQELIFASTDNSRNLVAPAGAETTAISFIQNTSSEYEEIWTTYLDTSNSRSYNITDIASVDNNIYITGSMTEQAPQEANMNNMRNLIGPIGRPRPKIEIIRGALVFSLNSENGEERWAKIGGASIGSISTAYTVAITEEKNITVGGAISKDLLLEWVNVTVTLTAFLNNDRAYTGPLLTHGFISLFDADGNDLWNKTLTAGTDGTSNVRSLEMTSHNFIVSGGNVLGDADLNGNDFEDDDEDDSNGNPGEKIVDRSRSLLTAFDQDIFVSVFDTYGPCKAREFCPNMEYEGLTPNNLLENTEYYYQVSYWRSGESEDSTTPSTELSSFINKTTGGGGGGSSDPRGGGGGPRTPSLPRTEVVRSSAPSTAIFQGNNQKLLLDEKLEFQEGTVSAARMYNLLHGEGPTTLQGSIEFARQRGIVNPRVLVQDPHRKLKFWEYIKMILHVLDRNSRYNEVEEWENGVYTAALKKGIVDQSMLEQIDNVHEKITREMAMESAYRAIKTKNENFTLEEFFKSNVLAQQFKDYQFANKPSTALRASATNLTALHFVVLKDLIKNNPNLKLENLPPSGYNRYSLTYGKLHSEFSSLENLTEEQYNQLRKDFEKYKKAQEEIEGRSIPENSIK